MANYSSFSPFGPTYLVGTSPVKVSANNNENPTAYRIRNLLNTQQYLSWVPSSNPFGGTPTITVTAPTAGNPSDNTMGFLPLSVEIIGTLPANAWFQAGTAAAFEITPGEGL